MSSSSCSRVYSTIIATTLPIESLRYLLRQASVELEALLLGLPPSRILLVLNLGAVSLFILERNVSLFILRELLFDLFDCSFSLALVGVVPRLLPLCGLLLILQLLLQLLLLKHDSHVLFLLLEIALADLLHNLLHLLGVTRYQAKRAILEDDVVLLEDIFDLGPRDRFDKEFVNAKPLDQLILIFILCHRLRENCLEWLVDACFDPLYRLLGRHPCLLDLELGFLVNVFDFLQTVLTRRSNHIIVNNQELDGLNHMARWELFQGHGFNQVFKKFIEEVHERDAVWMDDELVFDVELAELEPHRFLIDVIVVHVDNNTTLTIHVEHFFVREWHPIRAETDDVLNSNYLCILHILLLSLARDHPIRFMKQLDLGLFLIVHFKNLLVQEFVRLRALTG